MFWLVEILLGNLLFSANKLLLLLLGKYLIDSLLRLFPLLWCINVFWECFMKLLVVFAALYVSEELLINDWLRFCVKLVVLLGKLVLRSCSRSTTFWIHSWLSIVKLIALSLSRSHLRLRYRHVGRSFLIKLGNICFSILSLEHYLVGEWIHILFINNISVLRCFLSPTLIKTWFVLTWRSQRLVWLHLLGHWVLIDDHSFRRNTLHCFNNLLLWIQLVNSFEHRLHSFFVARQQLQRTHQIFFLPVA